MSRQNKPGPKKTNLTEDDKLLDKREELKRRLLDRHDMAYIFRVSTGTIYNWTRQGLFKIIPFPGYTYYDANDIEDIIEKYKQIRVPGEKRGRKKKVK